MISAQDIVSLLRQRRAARSPIMERMRLASRHYNNDIAIPLPELDENEAPAVANFIAQGIDQHGMRIASVMPTVDSPVIDIGEKSWDRARKRKAAAFGWLEQADYDLLLRRRSRHLVAYGASAIIVTPDPKRRTAAFDIRSPLDTYPAEPISAVDMHPCDVIFTFSRPWGWVQANYPAAAGTIAMNIRSNARFDTLKRDSVVEMCSYHDGEETVVVAYGVPWQPMSSTGTPYLRDTGDYWNHITHSSTEGERSWAVECNRAPNLIGECPVVYPQRLSLDTPRGQFDDTFGLYMMYAKLMALHTNAAFRAVFPETWLVLDPTLGGEVIRPADGLKGEIGVVRGGSLQKIAMDPGYSDVNTLNMIERAIRIDGSLPAEFSGESASNVRTDRRGNSVQAAMTDFHIDECQKLLGRSMKAELPLAAMIEMAYWPNDTRSFFVTKGGKPGPISYKPTEIFTESTVFTCVYPYAGLDVGQVAVTVGQEIGLGTLSKRTGMERIGEVDDVDEEFRRLDEEALDTAAREAILQQAATGAIPLPDIIRIGQLVKTERMDFFDAVQQVQQEAQERQASSGEQGTPAGPVDPNSPEAQPGLAQPGVGMEQPSVVPPPGTLGVRSLFNALGARNPAVNA